MPCMCTSKWLKNEALASALLVAEAGIEPATFRL